ncbi:hypothetical protein [Glaciecola sp. MF2-115]|uniref:hypothetical protein n=1 Tax=Glaciecola sp. MF2-115 TaxID=3384827 RepID=UPI00399FE9E9
MLNGSSYAHRKNDLFVFSLLFSISLIALYLPADAVRLHSPILFFSQALLVIYSVLKTGRLINFMTPAVLCILYISISCSLGAYAFYNNLLVGRFSYSAYQSWQFVSQSTFFLLFCNCLFFLVNIFVKPNYNLKFNASDVDEKLIFSTFGIMFLLTVPIALIFPDYSMIPKTISALLILYYLASTQMKFRYFIYIFILVLFAVSSVESKREAIFLIFPMIFLEALFSGIKLNISIFFKGIIFAFFLLSLIVLMSIARGYGGYEAADSLINALPFFFQYIENPIFLSAFFNNIEATSVYYNAMQSIDYVQKDTSLVAFGSTITKFLFVMIPREIWSDKPSSIIELYTAHHDPSYRAIGGSDPIIIYAEFFWNFHYFAILVLPILFYLITKLYCAIVSVLQNRTYFKIPVLLFVYMNFVTYVRGSGLDMYLAFTLIALIFSSGCFVIYCLLFKEDVRI